MDAIARHYILSSDCDGKLQAMVDALIERVKMESLSKQQKACLAAEILSNKEVKQYTRKQIHRLEKWIGRRIGVGWRYIHAAKKILYHNPKAFQRIKQGEASMKEENRVVKTVKVISTKETVDKMFRLVAQGCSLKDVQRILGKRCDRYQYKTLQKEFQLLQFFLGSDLPSPDGIVDYRRELVNMVIVKTKGDEDIVQILKIVFDDIDKTEIEMLAQCVRQTRDIDQRQN